MNSKYNELHRIYRDIERSVVLRNRKIQDWIIPRLGLCFLLCAQLISIMALIDVVFYNEDHTEAIKICIYIVTVVLFVALTLKMLVPWISRWCIFLCKASQEYGLGAAFGYFWKENPWLKYFAASFLGALVGLALANFLLLNNPSVASTADAIVVRAIGAAPIVRAGDININITINFTFMISCAGIGATLLKIWRKIKEKTTEQSNA